MSARFATRLRRNIWRERRRAAIVAVCMFIAGYLTVMQADPSGALHDRALGVGLVAALVITAGSVLLALVLPSFRFTEEIGAPALVGFSVAGMINPAYSLLSLAQGKTIWVLLALFIVLSHLYTSTLLDGWRISSPRTRRRATSRLPAQVLWDGLVGTPPHRERLSNADKVVAFDLLERGRPHRRIVERVDGMTLLEEHEHVVEIDAPRHFHYRWHAVSADESLGYARGEKWVRITDMGDRRGIEMTCAPNWLPVRLWVQTWIDDGMGRTLDEHLEALERRADNPAAPGAAAVA